MQAKTAGCGAFGLAKQWGLGHTKLFKASATRVPQPDWSMWVRVSATTAAATEPEREIESELGIETTLLISTDIRQPVAAEDTDVTVGSPIHVSKSLAGPWTPLKTSLAACACPSPWQLPNGTFYLVCQGTQNIQRAESLAGPWSVVVNISSNGMPGGPAGTYEDPM
jgi:hypothetical protein